MAVEEHNELIAVDIDSSYPHLDVLAEINEEAFPDEERFAFSDLLKLKEKGKAWFFAFEDAGVPVGFSCIISATKIPYGLFFAVDSRIRGRGYGTKAISLMKEKLGDTAMIYSVEALNPDAPNYEQRLKRVALYERLGSHRTGIVYMAGDAELEIMTNAENISREEIDEMMGTLREVFAVLHED